MRQPTASCVPRFFHDPDSELNEPILHTPEPLTPSRDTKKAMLVDRGSWDGAFDALTASVCRDLTAVSARRVGCIDAICRVPA